MRALWLAAAPFVALVLLWCLTPMAAAMAPDLGAGLADCLRLVGVAAVLVGWGVKVRLSRPARPLAEPHQVLYIEGEVIESEDYQSPAPGH